MASTPSSLAERGQRLGLKLIAKAGGLPALQDPEPVSYTHLRAHET